MNPPTPQLANVHLRCIWSTEGGALRPVSAEDRTRGGRVDLAGAEIFRLVFRGGGELPASQLAIAAQVVTDDRVEVTFAPITLRTAGGGAAAFDLSWRAFLREPNDRYVRQELRLTARERVLPLVRLVMLEIPARGVARAGSVGGVPLVSGTMFFGIEHPSAEPELTDRFARLALQRPADLGRDETLAVTGVIGATGDHPSLRRAFAEYVGRERARPHRVFLHYNSWFDVSWAGKKLSEAECVGAVRQIGQALTERRGLPLDAFVFDDGWDDHNTLWQIDRTMLPRGFRPIREAAAHFGSGLGTWISPWGGYDPAKPLRIEAAKREGLAVTSEGLSLADPRYLARIREAAAAFVRDDDLRYLKLDGISARQLQQLEALCGLIRELRAMKPDLFVNLTVGTWPSPFWLWHGDAIWRGGNDMGAAGAGDAREQWITYRDAETFKNVVTASPLFPLAALMTHGIVNGQHGPSASMSRSGPSFTHEIRSYFGSGVGLQELYLTPARMQEADWDRVAACARWSRSRRDVLEDVHWVGGDPAAGEPYGWAAYRNGRGTLVLRSPSEQRRTLALRLDQALELPDGVSPRLRLEAVEDGAPAGAPGRAIEVRRDAVHGFALEPFEVKMFDLVPVEGASAKD